MPGRSYNQYCALARSLDVVGDRWSMLIVRNLLLGPLRWSDLVATLPKIAKNLLASRLRGLQEDGVVVQGEAGYALTERGAALEPVLFALADWGESHGLMGPPREGEAIRLRYLMTSLRRKLKPGAQRRQVQLWVDGDPFRITLGPVPAVKAGDGTADAVARCELVAFVGFLQGRVSVDGLDVEGASDALRELRDAVS